MTICLEKCIKGSDVAKASSLRTQSYVRSYNLQLKSPIFNKYLNMESYTIMCMVILAIVVSSTAYPPSRIPHFKQRPIIYHPVAESRSSNIGEPKSEDRMSLGSLGSFGWGSQKMPFDLISGPYHSSLGQGYSVPGGYGGLSFGGLPLISGPVSGSMGLPLMMLAMTG